MDLPWRFGVVPIQIDGVLHDITDAGLCIGHRMTPDGVMRAVSVTQHATIDLGTLGGSTSAARGTNDRGIVVGGALTFGDVAHHGFVFAAGTMRDLNDLIDPTEGWEVIHALGINNRSEIVAVAQRDGLDHVVLLRPLCSQSR